MKTLIPSFSKFLFLVVIFLSIQARASEIETINFTAPIWFVSAVPNAGNLISGSLTFDPTTMVMDMQNQGNGYASYIFGTPATFTFTTNGGFSLTQELTAFNVADMTQNGLTDYYVFDADFGEINITPFSRLELGLSSNSNPNIANLDIPQSLNLSDFQFKTALYYNYDSNGHLINRIVGTVSALNIAIAAVSEPDTSAMLLMGAGLMGFMARRRKNAQA